MFHKPVLLAAYARTYRTVPRMLPPPHPCTSVVHGGIWTRDTRHTILFLISANAQRFPSSFVPPGTRTHVFYHGRHECTPSNAGFESDALVAARPN